MAEHEWFVVNQIGPNNFQNVHKNVRGTVEDIKNYAQENDYGEVIVVRKVAHGTEYSGIEDVVQKSKLPWRARLQDAFELMRKCGLQARMNFACCMSCGFYELKEKAEKMKKQPVGVIFYHRQDEDHIRLADKRGDTPYVNLAFGAYGKYQDQQVADLAISCLTTNGLAVEWDGDVSKRLKVILQ